MLLLLNLMLFAAPKASLGVELISPLKIDINHGSIYNMVLGDNNEVYFTSVSERKIFATDLAGSAYKTIGKSGMGPFEFRLPMALAYQSPYLYISDSVRRRIYQYNTHSEEFIQEWQFPPSNHLFIEGETIFSSLTVVDPFSTRHRKGYVMMRSDVTDPMKATARYYQEPCCMTIKGTKRGAVLLDSKGVLWAAYTGDYAVKRFLPNGKLLQTIKYEPADFSPPPTKRVNRFDRKALKNHFISFDKIGNLFQWKDLILMYRFKRIDDARLDIFDLEGNIVVQGVNASGVVPFAIKDQTLYGHRENLTDDDADVDLVKISLRLPRNHQN